MSDRRSDYSLCSYVAPSLYSYEEYIKELLVILCFLSDILRSPALYNIANVERNYMGMAVSQYCCETETTTDAGVHISYYPTNG